MTHHSGTLLFRVLLPTQELLSMQVLKVTAEAPDGLFCVLPKHIDFVATLVPSVLTYWTADQDGYQNDHLNENYLAVNHGVLVKYADTITVSAFDGVVSDNLEQLQAKVDQHFLNLDDHERKARTALARLEAATLRGFRELQERIND